MPSPILVYVYIGFLLVDVLPSPKFHSKTELVSIPEEVFVKRIGAATKYSLCSVVNEAFIEVISASSEPQEFKTSKNRTPINASHQ